ncbi:MAG: amidohydrolase family protein [Phycisphaerales bacterium]
MLPALVNAHTHLDLTHIGPQPHDPSDGFVSWVDMVRSGRHDEPLQIAEAVLQGCDLLKRGGVSLVGDIAGAPMGQPSLIPFETLADSGLGGVSYLEFFAIGTRTRSSVERVESLLDSTPVKRLGEIRLGLQPHAPNTVAPEAFLAAGRLAERFDLPLITHLAESVEERQFVAEGAGPQLELIQRLGIWDEATAALFGKGLSPIQHLSAVLAGFDMCAVHVNQCSDDDLNLLALTNTPVVYCPRASAYFGAQSAFGPHRYQEMLERGITVSLGTDSIINLPAEEVATTGLSPLAEARLLYRRDNADPGSLLRMMTTNGTRVLGEPETRVLLSEGAEPAGVIAIEARGSGSPLERVMSSDAAPSWITSR